jgi:hypothetical protein
MGANLERTVDPVGDHESLKIPHVPKRLAAGLGDHVLGTQAGLGRRAAVEHFDHLDALVAAGL